MKYTVVRLVGSATKRFIAFGSFLLSPMKGNDFLISEIVEKKQNKKVMHENLNPLNNILVLYPMKRPFVF